MSLRSPSEGAARKRPAKEDDRIVLSIGRRGRSRKVALPAGVVYAVFGLLPVLGAIYLGATGYLFYRDDMIAALMARQARQQYAYEGPAREPAPADRPQSPAAKCSNRTRSTANSAR